MTKNQYFKQKALARRTNHFTTKLQVCGHIISEGERFRDKNARKVLPIEIWLYKQLLTPECAARQIELVRKCNMSAQRMDREHRWGLWKIILWGKVEV